MSGPVLAACPCGGTPKARVLRGHQVVYGRVICQLCGRRGPVGIAGNEMDAEEQAAEQWNKTTKSGKEE